MTAFPDKVSIGDKYKPAIEIRDQDEADAYFEKCVEHTMRFGRSREEAEQVERSNLGYFAGYYSNETRERVERLYRCKHPVFGALSEKGAPSTEQALKAGVNAGAGQ